MGEGVLHYITLYCILSGTDTTLRALEAPFELGFCLHAYGSLGGPEIVKDVLSYYDSLLLNKPKIWFE
jgi:hypothetical protein